MVILFTFLQLGYIFSNQNFLFEEKVSYRVLQLPVLLYSVLIFDFFFSTLSYCSLYPFFNHSIYLICFSFNHLFFNVIIPVFTVFRLAYAKSYLVTNHSFVFFFQFSFNISYCFQRNIFCHQIVKHCALNMFFPKSFLFFLLYLRRPVLNLHFLKYIVHNIKFSQKFLRIV